ncbi:MAG: carboxypeptidase-like regulatory domain-containing protein [Methanosarcinaceae archaeon]|nr:carboxypeptidase-like regulatory domain-containing protein [Methanosarcinaceae archaeon]
MVATPYTISGTIYDVDGTFVLASATIRVTNKRLNETRSTSTDTNGEYVIDLANYKGYRNGDPILIEAYILGDSVKKYKNATVTVNTTTGYSAQDLTVEPITDDFTISSRHEDIFQRTFNYLSNKFKVDLPTNASTEEKQDTSNTSLSTIAGDTTSIDGKITACDTTGKATSAKQDTLITNTNALATMVTTAVTLTTLNIAYLIPTIEQVGRRTIIIYNVSDTDVFYGASNVTTTTGILIPAGGKDAIDCESGLYAVCGTSGKIINALEMK